MDLDVIQTGPNTYQLAYCDNHEIFTVEISQTDISEPKCVYSIKPEEGEKTQASFRSLRYLKSGFVVAAVNKPNSAGVALHGYRLPKSDEEEARLAIQRKLPKSVSKATGLAVRNLSPVSSPTEKQDETQFVVAVAGNDSSISLLTLEHQSHNDVDLLSNLAPFQTIQKAHDSNITNLSFSVFTPPSSSKTPSELSVKLASVDVGSKAVIHSIPLRKYVDKSAPTRKGGPPKASRYVVAVKTQRDYPISLITVVALGILFMAILGQTMLESKNLTKPILGAKNYLPASWTVPDQPQSWTISDMLDALKPKGLPVVIRQAESGGLPKLQVTAHDEEKHGPARPWEELDLLEQDLWKQRLKKTGHWVEEMGEVIFRGVLFGEIRGGIGHVVAEAL
jgi:hypothetical protein